MVVFTIRFFWCLKFYRSTAVIAGLLACCRLSAAWLLSPSKPAPLRTVGRLSMSSRAEDSLRHFGPKTTPLLDAIKQPSDMKRLTIDELKQLTYELRCLSAMLNVCVSLGDFFPRSFLAYRTVTVVMIYSSYMLDD